ncbi:TIGR02266 family protein [Myxococcota bacterium]|nr:TIGR02266 family protein [Myxococcota bacterium]MBU1379297.1 TIGR02266 family protein [Myxococcota bacterium]MBU1497870.1 TIGR02266 family protein [Myxococcota bacterium]
MENQNKNLPPPVNINWDEKRVHKRFKYVVEVSIKSSHNFFTGLTNDISEGGLFINTFDIQPLGTILDIQILLPGMEKETTLRTEVVWLRPPTEMNSTDSQVGMGLRLIDPSDELSNAIKRYVRRHEPMFYDV